MKTLIVISVLLFGTVCFAEEEKPIDVVIPQGDYMVVVQTGQGEPDISEEGVYIFSNGKTVRLTIEGADETSK